MNSRRRDGVLETTYDGQGKLIERLYGTMWGRLLLWVLVRPWVSRLGGWLLERRISRWLIPGFIRRNRLELRDYPKREYRSFNDFFTRRILPERRPVDIEPEHLIAPCDGKLTVVPIWPGTRFTIKGVSYDMESLLRDETLARRYRGGMLLLFRLTVDDYHRYCYASDGIVGTLVRIPGVYHTVNPRAAAARPIYRENTREYGCLETAYFGTILMMEVGALLVGRIQNHPVQGFVQRGQEKGLFAFGGSTVILVLEKDRVQMDEDILRNSAAGEETLVRMGEKIGTAQKQGGTLV